MESEAGKLNAPNRAKTEALLELATGLPDVLSDISWQGRSASSVQTELDDFIVIRGEIVHKGQTPGELDKPGVESWISFFDRLTERVDAKIARHLDTTFSVSPW